jgi:hypothetical protein
MELAILNRGITRFANGETIYNNPTTSSARHFFEEDNMTIVVRRRNRFRRQMLTVVLLSILAGLVGGALVGLATSHRSVVQESPS